MKQFLNMAVLFGLVGAFSCGFVFWMADSAHREAQHLRRYGQYCDVRIVDKKSSSEADGSSDNYYVYVRPQQQKGDSPAIECAVLSTAYDKLQIGQQLKAWVLGSDALLDDAPKNAGPVARRSLWCCLGFALLGIGGLVAKVFCRTKELSQ